MLKHHLVVEVGVQQLVNTLTMLLNSSQKTSQKVMAASRHALFTVNGINDTLSKAHEANLMSESEIAHAVKLVLLSFNSALRTRVDTLFSTDKKNRRYSLANMLERHMLLSLHDGIVNNAAKKAFENGADELRILKGENVTTVKIAGSVEQIKKQINSNLPRNPYSTAVLSV